jgi:hypothetical protein
MFEISAQRLCAAGRLQEPTSAFPPMTMPTPVMDTTLSEEDEACTSGLLDIGARVRATLARWCAQLSDLLVIRSMHRSSESAWGWFLR